MTTKTWDFFKDDLNYPEIQVPGPLAFLAESMAESLDVELGRAEAVRKQHFPMLCEKESLKYHAKGRGINRHHKESEDKFRIRVAQAFAWQKLAGRFRGLHKIFEHYGFPIIRFSELKGSQWAEFDLVVESKGALDDDVWDLIFWMANEYKRASAKLRSLRLAKQIRGRIFMRSAVAIGEHITVFPLAVNPAPAKPNIKNLMATITHENWRIYPR